MFQISKRVLLYILVNLLVMATVSLSFALISAFVPLPPFLLGGLVLYCTLFGFGGALISLMLSRVMAKWSMGVRVIDSKTAFGRDLELVETVHRLSQKANLSVMPEVGIYESTEVNAFATGPSKSRSLVAVSSGLLAKMDHAQLEGVLGHEIGHITNGDMVTMTLLQGIINSVVMILARLIAGQVSGQVEERSRFWVRSLLIFGLDMILSLLGSLVVFYFSRRREFRADFWGAKLAGRGQMISALQALSHALPDEEIDRTFGTLKISEPRQNIARLFMSHPPLEERIAALEKLTH